LPDISHIWTIAFLQPMLNCLLWLYSVLGHNFALSITVFTILVRLITLPLTIPQMTSSKKMQELQPKLKELQKKFAGDKEGMSRAQMDLYKEHGVNPLGGCLPTLVQFPVWIGLYQSISQVMATNPLAVLQLSKNIYPQFPGLSQLIPLDDRFLWLNLGRPDPLYILPVLVAASMFFQQKLMSVPATDPQSESMTKSMNYTMPLMFGFFSLSFSSGLSIYFVVSSLVGIAIQYGLNKHFGLGPGTSAARNKTTTTNQKSEGGLLESLLSLLGSSKSTSEVGRLPAASGNTVEGIVVTQDDEDEDAGTAMASPSDTAEKGKRRRARKKKR
jgi:YidC/Oxa1 family membrane protein insertase